MNKLSAAKIIDNIDLVAIVALFVLWIFKLVPSDWYSLILLLIAIIKMASYYLRAAYYRDMYDQTRQERDIFKEKSDYFEKKFNELNNK